MIQKCLRDNSTKIKKDKAIMNPIEVRESARCVKTKQTEDMENETSKDEEKQGRKPMRKENKKG